MRLNLLTCGRVLLFLASFTTVKLSGQCTHPNPTYSGSTSLNCGQTTTLNAWGSGPTFMWFNAPSNGTLLGTGSNFTTPPMGATDTLYVANVSLSSGSQTFNYTGSQQTFTVPAGVFSINVDARGARGGGHSYGQGGLGGRVQGNIPVNPGDVIYIQVGQQGSASFGYYSWTSNNAYNGGGVGQYCSSCCSWWQQVGAGGGGGATDIRIGGTTLSDRVLVAGGGGGAGGHYYNSCCSDGGHGGDLNGASGGGWNWPGGGGSQTAGGTATNTQTGSLGMGGNGQCWSTYWGGGGGGGGYYGGGGGNYGGGGGGGSSYTAPQVTGVSHSQGVHSGDGQVTISWAAITCSSQMVPIPIAVSNTTQAPTVTGTTSIVCGQSTTLTASGSGNTFHWYADSVTNTTLHQSAAYATGILTASDTFYVATLNTYPGGLEICHSPRTPVIVNVNDTVLPPVISGSNVICGFADTLIATGSSGHFRWYNQGIGGTPFSTSDTVITPQLTSAAVYYVEATSVPNAPYCVSPRIAVQIGIIPVPVPLVQNDTIICGGSTTLTASGSTGVFSWYNTPSGGTAFSTDTTVAVSPETTTTYYVEAFSTPGPYNQTTTYTSPGHHTFTVPSGVFSLTVDVRGAQGGSHSWSSGGLGGRVTATIPVTPGAVLNIHVGAQGTAVQGTYSNTSSPSYNGGGTGNYCTGHKSYHQTGGGSGGGASDIRIGGNSFNERVVVAGGGGGAGGYYQNCCATGGAGGNTTGASGGGWNWPGSGGDQTGGGWSNSQWGSFGNGGNGSCYTTYWGGGGGGGGWYGGGGGSYGGGGGGGSSYTVSQASNVAHQQGTQSGNGYVSISWDKPYCISQRVPVSVIVNKIADPNPIHDTVNCASTALVGASGSTGFYNWYAQPNDTNIMAQGAFIATPPVISPQTFHVQAFVPGTTCLSNRVPVHVVIDSLPAPTVNGHDSLCNSGSTVFTASGGNNPYSWFSAPGGTLLGTGTTYSTGTQTDTLVVYVRYQNGLCVSPYSTGTLIITPMPSATITAPDTLCSSDPAQLLLVNSTGGVWTGTGVQPTTGVFIPLLANIGPNQIIYNITHGVCSDIDTAIIVVNQGPDVAIYDPGPLCAQSNPIAIGSWPAGGQYSGVGFTNTSTGTFNPSLATPGFNQLVYTYTAFGCTGSDTLQLMVHATPNATITPVAAVCSGDPGFQLQTATPGGIFSGNGILDVNSGLFDPASAGSGTSQIIYQITQNGCPGVDTLSIVVNNTPNPTITHPGPICNNQSLFAFNAQTPGGTWTGPGILNNNLGTFNPQTAPLGTYNISYNVSQNGCASANMIQVTVSQAPDATILSAPSQICANANPVFLGSLFPGGIWSGAGITDSIIGIMNPQTMNPGNNSIQYTMVAANGCSDSKWTTVNVIQALSATILSPVTTLCDNTPVFNLFAASTGGVWSGPGIVNPTLGTFSPSFAGTGTAQVVYATNQNGCFDSDTLAISIVTAPTILLNPNGPQEFCENAGFTLQANGGITYRWFKDNVEIPNQTGNSLPVNQSGSYYVIGSGGFCESTTNAVPVTINPAPQILNINAAAVCEGQTTSFNSNTIVAQNTGSVINGYLWHFGNGNTANGSQVQHQYATAGTYLAQLIVTTNKGCSDTLAQNISVNPIPQIVSTVVPNGCQSSISPFQANATVANINNAGISQYLWTFGNGLTGLGANTSHLYAQPGPYSWTLTVTSNHGCSSQTSGNIMVYPAPVANFNALGGCQGTSIVFNNLSNGGSTYLWNFGDGQTDTLYNPMHTYQSGGQFNPTLTVTNANGCSSTFGQALSITPAPLATFYSTPFGGLTYQFTPNNVNGAANYGWDFGDGSTSTQMSPMKTYLFSGNYTVCLNVTLNGCTNKECREVSIFNQSGIGDDALAAIMVYPNPFSESFVVNMNIPTSEKISMAITDMSGREIARKEEGIKNAGEHQFHWNTNSLSLTHGMYILRVNTGENVNYFKLTYSE